MTSKCIALIRFETKSTTDSRFALLQQLRKSYETRQIFKVQARTGPEPDPKSLNLIEISGPQTTPSWLRN